MQDWKDQAEKNNLVIRDNGKCQLCGSETKKGLFECVEKSNYIAHKLNHDDGIRFMTIFLCVDAHALQHSEIHGRWNNHFHLTRLNLMLNMNIKWNYKLSPLLSEVINSYKIIHPDERIKAPEKEKRGVVTITDVEKSETDAEYIELVTEWAKGVYNSFTEGHEIVSRISHLFINKYKGKLFF